MRLRVFGAVAALLLSACAGGGELEQFRERLALQAGALQSAEAELERLVRENASLKGKASVTQVASVHNTNKKAQNTRASDLDRREKALDKRAENLKKAEEKNTAEAARLAKIEKKLKDRANSLVAEGTMDKDATIAAQGAYIKALEAQSKSRLTLLNTAGARIKRIADAEQDPRVKKALRRAQYTTYTKGMRENREVETAKANLEFVNMANNLMAEIECISKDAYDHKVDELEKTARQLRWKLRRANKRLAEFEQKRLGPALGVKVVRVSETDGEIATLEKLNKELKAELESANKRIAKYEELERKRAEKIAELEQKHKENQKRLAELEQQIKEMKALLKKDAKATTTGSTERAGITELNATLATIDNGGSAPSRRKRNRADSVVYWRSQADMLEVRVKEKVARLAEVERVLKIYRSGNKSQVCGLMQEHATRKAGKKIADLQREAASLRSERAKQALECSGTIGRLKQDAKRQTALAKTYYSKFLAARDKLDKLDPKRGTSLDHDKTLNNNTTDKGGVSRRHLRGRLRVPRYRQRYMLAKASDRSE